MAGTTQNWVPSFYSSLQCGELRVPNCAAVATEAREYSKKNKIISTAESDRKNPRIILCIIDNQIDFVSKKHGNLYVEGAEKDTDRIVRFIYRNLTKISHIICSLDTHYLFQPFHPLNWIAGDNPTMHAFGPLKGQHYNPGDCPDPFTQITLAMTKQDIWAPARKPQRQLEMLEKLENEKKKTLVVWPFHCFLGSIGHSLDSTLMEAIVFHSTAKNDQYDLTEKGMSQSGEHYGILKSEVEFSDDSLTHLNLKMIQKWELADRVYFCGQAKSHCVNETLKQLTTHLTNNSKQTLLNKFYVLNDCMSSVPDIKDDKENIIAPFDQWAEADFKTMASQGMKFVKSTDPIDL